MDQAGTFFYVPGNGADIGEIRKYENTCRERISLTVHIGIGRRESILFQQLRLRVAYQRFVKLGKNSQALQNQTERSTSRRIVDRY